MAESPSVEIEIKKEEAERMRKELESLLELAKEIGTITPEMVEAYKKTLLYWLLKDWIETGKVWFTVISSKAKKQGE